MNNFEFHEMAQELADTKTAYSLARELVELQNSIPKIKADAVREFVSRFEEPEDTSRIMYKWLKRESDKYANKLERGE